MRTIYDFVLFIHIAAAIVGFGSSFVWPALASKARGLGPEKGYVLTHTSLELSKRLTSIPIYVTGGSGVLLILLADRAGRSWDFSDPWISIAFVLFFAALGVSLGLHYPNLKKMDALSAALAAGNATPGAQGGPPVEVLELQDRGKQAAMYGGILHLLFVLLLADMIWKPFF
jgi:hypothetical protein